jgi:hypothetical protein
MSVSKTSARKAIKLLQLQPWNIMVAHAYKEHDLAARVPFCNRFLQSVHNGKVDLRLVFFSYKACFLLHREVNSKNSQYWSTENPGLMQKLLFYD